jgi:PLP dependent protein
MIAGVGGRLTEVERRIAAACSRSGRRRDEVLLIAVTKTFGAPLIDEAIAAGVSDIGENRVQEFRDKRPLIRSAARAHLIGHLQSNKAREAARLFDVIHSIDSAELARRLDRAAGEQGRRLEVLIQVNSGNEPQKGGIDPGGILALAEQLTECTNLDMTGMMTIPPIADEKQTRHFFAQLRQLREELVRDERFSGARELSMGMTDDFELAIEEGATMIRVGRAIFGERVR